MRTILDAQVAGDEAADPGDNDDVSAMTERGISLSNEGDVAAALEAFRLAAQRRPDAAQHRNVGVALMRLGQVEEAILAFRLCVAADPNYADGHRLLAEALRAAGRTDESIETMQAGLQVGSDRVGDLRAIARLLRQQGRPAEAAIYLEQAVRSAGAADPTLLRELGLSRLESARFASGDVTAAVRDLEAALKVDPRDVAAHVCLAVALEQLGECDRAVAQYELALLLHRAAPCRWPSEFSRDVARIGLRCEGGETDLPPAGQRLLTVLVGCYGDFPQYSLRCLQSVAAAEDFTLHCELLIGLNDCCQDTVAAADRLLSDGVATGVIRSTRNLNKDRMMRLLLEQAQTPYVLWLDDDSHFLQPGWAGSLCSFIRDEHPFDVAGQIARYGPHRFRDAAYVRFVAGRPWWKTADHLPADLREHVPFALGGMFVARTAFLRRHDFPDRGMTKALDDVALGDLLLQKGGRLLSLTPELLAMASINDGRRRGEDFDLPPTPRQPT